MIQGCPPRNTISLLVTLTRDVSGLYPYRQVVSALAQSKSLQTDTLAQQELPDAQELNQSLKAAGLLGDIRLTSPLTQSRKALKSLGGPAAAYVRTITVLKQVPTRPNNLHDFSNALTWATFPKTKSMVFELLHQDYLKFLANDASHQAGRGRSSFGDLLTGLDEAGAIEIRTKTKVLVIWFGHAILENIILEREPVSVPTWILDIESSEKCSASQLDGLLDQGGQALDELLAERLLLRLTSKSPSSDFYTWVGHRSCTELTV